mgnify:FL=1
MINTEPDFTNDPYWGKGGSYVVDPATGKRSPVPAPAVDASPAAEPVPAQTGHRPDDAAPGTQVDAQGLAPAVETEKPLKGKRNG